MEVLTDQPRRMPRRVSKCAGQSTGNGAASLGEQTDPCRAALLAAHCRVAGGASPGSVEGGEASCAQRWLLCVLPPRRSPPSSATPVLGPDVLAPARRRVATGTSPPHRLLRQLSVALE